MFAVGELDICSPCEQSIYFSLRSKFDMLPSATSVASAAHIERRVSDAYRLPEGVISIFLSICSPLANSIFARLASNRYIFRSAQNSICCLRQRVSRQRRISTPRRGDIDIFLSICSPLANSIFARLASNRYIFRSAQNSICCLRQRVSLCDCRALPHLVLPQGKTYRLPEGEISSRHRRHIERRVSDAYRRRVVV